MVLSVGRSLGFCQGFPQYRQNWALTAIHFSGLQFQHFFFRLFEVLLSSELYSDGETSIPLRLLVSRVDSRFKEPARLTAT